MSPRGARALLVFMVALHLTLVLAYTLPRALVPDRMFHWGQRYVRPLFHQRWNLFAPDPWLHACRVEVGLADGSWRPIIPADRHYLHRRMARPLAELVEAAVQQGDTVLPPILASTVRNAVRDLGRDGQPLKFRLVRSEVTDPERPQLRSTRIIPVHLPAP